MFTGLATIFLTAAILAAGTGTASATLFCANQFCTETYPAETALTAELEEGTQAQLLTSVGTVKCKSSAITGKTTAKAGKPLPLEIAKLTFGECEIGETACTVTTTTLPTSPSLEASGEGNGILGLEGGEVQFKCGALISCTYATPALQFEGGNPASLSAEEVTLTRKGFCPAKNFLDATYALAEPAPAYLSEGEGQTLLCANQSCTETYPAETALGAELEEGTQAKLLTSSGTVKCESSTIAGQTSAEAGTPLPLQITELSFGKCELEGKEACTATTESLPTSPYFAAGSGGNGIIGLTGGEVNFKCGFFIRCTYAMPTLLFEGGNPASFGAAEVELGEFKGLVCPETSKLHVAYTLTKPAPAYLALL